VIHFTKAASLPDLKIKSVLTVTHFMGWDCTRSSRLLREPRQPESPNKKVKQKHTVASVKKISFLDQGLSKKKMAAGPRDMNKSSFSAAHLYKNTPHRPVLKEQSYKFFWV
jgi:hypothetical protein